MYPHPELNSFLQGFGAGVSKKILNRAVDKAMLDKESKYGPRSTIPKVFSAQPRCYAPDVDVTRAKCAFGSLAIPKLVRELHSEDSLVVRQSVTTLADLLLSPEKLVEAVQHKVVDRLAELLVSKDAYLRERVAGLLVTIGKQTTGREAILRNLHVLANLSKGINDESSSVRLQMAGVLEVLARDYCVVDMLCNCGFLEAVAKFEFEGIETLVVRLEILSFLLYRDVKAEAIKAGILEKLVGLLKRKDERIVRGALACLSVLCEDDEAKRKAMELDLLDCLKRLVVDDRETVSTEACRLVSFVTTTTPGKLRALEIGILTSLLRLARDECHSRPSPRRLAILKALSNIAEAPEARAILLRNFEFIERINVHCDEVLMQHKQTLLDLVLWKP